jgi:protein SMG7
MDTTGSPFANTGTLLGLGVNNTTSPIAPAEPLPGRGGVGAVDHFGFPMARQQGHGQDFTNAPPDGPRDNSVSPRNAALNRLTTSLFAQYGLTPETAQGPADVSSRVGGQQRSVSGSAGLPLHSNDTGIAASMQRSASQQHDHGAGFPSVGLAQPRMPAERQSAFAGALSPQQRHMASPRGTGSTFGTSQPGRQMQGSPNGSLQPQYAPWPPEQSADTSLAFSHPSSLFGGTPALGVEQAPLNSVSCNGNYFNASTPYGRLGGGNNRDDPTHFRNLISSMPGPADDGDSYDRQVLQAALMDNSTSQQRPKR